MGIRKIRLRKIIIMPASLVILLVVGIMIFNNNGSNYDPRAPKEPEAGGPIKVNLLESEKLIGYLLPAQLEATKKAITDFAINSEHGDGKTATVIGNVKQTNGVVSFEFKLNDSKTTYEVNIDKWKDYKNIHFSIPSKNYEKVVEVYSQQ